MKKYLALVCATMMCVCCLGLAACGGSGSASGSAASDAASDSASASAAASASESESAASSVAVDPAEEFVGTWQLAAVEYEGIVMTGDYSLMFGDAQGAVLKIQADGKGSMNLGGNESEIAWEDKGNGKFAITGAASESGESIDAVLEDDEVSIALESDEFSGIMVFTKDGTTNLAQEIDVDAAEEVTSESDLDGTYKLSALSMMGLSMYGDPDDLAAVMDSTSGTDTSIVFNGDGTAKFMGEDVEYAVSSDGAYFEEDGVQIPILMLDDDVVIDAGAMTGGVYDMVMVFSK